MDENINLSFRGQVIGGFGDIGDDGVLIYFMLAFAIIYTAFWMPIFTAKRFPINSII